MSSINIKNIYLYNENPRHTMNDKSISVLKEMSESKLKDDNNFNAAKKLLKFEGDFSDLLDLIESLDKKGYKEKTNPLILLKLGNKFLTTDGNRRFLAINLLNKNLDFSELINDEKMLSKPKAMKNFDKINEIINESKFNYSDFEHAVVYEQSDIDEMFDEINLNHIGQGNGKRNWPRGKMLKEIYNIYTKDDLKHDECIEEIIQKHGVSKKKAESDIIPSVFCNLIFEEYKKNNQNSEIELEMIAPSSLELVKGTRLDEVILYHEKNYAAKKNLGSLLGIKLSKDTSTGKVELKIENEFGINIENLSNLLMTGYEYDESSLSNEQLEAELDKEFEEDYEKENRENAGLIRNRFFTTRSWTENGTIELVNLLNWPDAPTIEKKVEKIIEEPSSIFRLSILDAKEIVGRNDSEIDEDIKSALISVIEMREKREKMGDISLQDDEKNNHIYSVLSTIYKNEYLRIERFIEKQAFPLAQKDILSQLSVLRSMNELILKLLLNITFNMLFKYSDVKYDEFIQQLKVSENYRDLKNEEWGEIIKLLNIRTDQEELQWTFTKMKEKMGTKIVYNITQIFGIAKESCTFTDEEIEKKYQGLKKITQKLHDVNSAGAIGVKLSLPMHHIEKFINEIDLVVMTKLAKDFTDIENVFTYCLNYIISNQEILYSDGDLRNYFVKK